MLKNSPNLFADYIEITTRLNFVGKGVSDLEMFMYALIFQEEVMKIITFIYFPPKQLSNRSWEPV